MNHMNCNRVKHAGVLKKIRRSRNGEPMSASLHPLYATADRDGKLLRQICLLAQGPRAYPINLRSIHGKLRSNTGEACFAD